MGEFRVLRPMGYGDIVNEVFDLYKRNFILFAGIAAVVFIPSGLLEAVTAGSEIVTATLGLAVFLLEIVADGAITKAVTDRYLGRESSIATSWRYILSRLAPYLLTTLLALLMIFGGLILFCVPGIIALFWTFFIWNIMIVEGLYYRDAIRRSRELAASQWGRVFVVGLGMVLLYAAVLFVGALILQAGPEWILASRGGSPGAADLPLWLTLSQGVLNGAILSLAAPITALPVVLLYFDVRVRKEGFDIELLSEEIGKQEAL